MTTHTVGTREDWLAARLELLEAEKALTRQTTRSPGSARRCPGCRSRRTTAS